LLAERGETVHVIGQLWEQGKSRDEQHFGGKLVIHRVPYEDGASLLPQRPHPALMLRTEKRLFQSAFPPQCFSWQAAQLAERLVEEEGIDLIEAQEYEAPLYYFQVRRALGLGPERRPPCLVHFHSPTELIAKYNHWDAGLPRTRIATRLEAYTIEAADALLCPSRYLACQAEAHYGLAPGTIDVIPYPIGDSRMVTRADDIWQRGTICYLGRLEPRKGVLEWIDAATSVAREYRNARFEFIGADILDRGSSVRARLERRIPSDLKSRFRFYGERPRRSLPQYLATARVAVVPSRWDNFPYTCIEAMASGLPVIATREGGMAEMVEDGRTGWLAESPSPEKLADTLRRALATPAEQLAEMGRRATAAIQHICHHGNVAEAHITLRQQLVRRGSRGGAEMRADLFGRFPEFAAGDNRDVDQLVELMLAPSKHAGTTFLDERLALARMAVRFPASTARYIGRRLRNKFQRHIGNWLCGSAREATWEQPPSYPTPRTSAP
jgi:glycosyltransferase involved in cell wall biosynthesis